MEPIITLGRELRRAPVQHFAQAHLTLPKSGIWLPGIEDAFDELIMNQPRERWRQLDTKDRYARAVVKALTPLFGLLGVGLHEKARAELFAELIHGKYFVAGGSQLGDYAESQIMKHIFRNTAIFTPPANIAVQLYTAATSDANSTGTLVSGGSYATVNVGTTTGWSDPGATGGATDNAAAIDFGTASANWGTVSHVSLEVAGGANRLFHGALTASKVVNSGDSFQFATGDLDVTIA